MEQNFSAGDFFTFSNPIVISLTIAFFVIVMLAIVYSDIFLPMLRKHKLEKITLKKKNAEISNSLILIDPNPIIRIDDQMNILLTNPAAGQIADSGDISGHVKEIFSKLSNSLQKIIDDNLSEFLALKIGDRIYNISVSGVNSLNAAQIYFDDKTDELLKEEEIERYRKKARKASLMQDIEVDNERKRISKELHDSLTHKLLLANKSLSDLDTNGNSESLPSIIDILNESISEARNLSHNLRPIEIEDNILKDSLQKLNIRLNSIGNLSTEFIYQNLPENIEFEVKLNIHRIIEEAFNNVLKHADAKKFTVDLLFNDKKLNLLITDNGKGFEVKRLSNGMLDSMGNGIINIQERVQSMSGYFDVDSFPGEGTNLIIEIPIG